MNNNIKVANIFEISPKRTNKIKIYKIIIKNLNILIWMISFLKLLCLILKQNLCRKKKRTFVLINAKVKHSTI